jgi:hypothetical protein
MTEAEQKEIAIKACELKHRLEGSSNVQSLMLGQYSNLCNMGAYEQAQALRHQLHDYLDVFLDSCVENSKLMRRIEGLP